MAEFNFSLSGVNGDAVEGFKSQVVSLFNGLIVKPSFLDLESGASLKVTYDDNEFDATLRHVYANNIPHLAQQVGLNKV